MNNVYLVGLKIRGIKNLDRLVELSFYKKTFKMPIETQDYNIKGIYGMNGAGKSGIITAVDILKNLLINADYLNNPVVQKNLDEIINRQLKELYLEVEYLINTKPEPLLYHYETVLYKDLSGKYVIGSEKLLTKLAASRKTRFELLAEVNMGEIVFIKEDDDHEVTDLFRKKSANLLLSSSMSVLYIQKILLPDKVPGRMKDGILEVSLSYLFAFGSTLQVYMDQSDNHIDYVANDMLLCAYGGDEEFSELSEIFDNWFKLYRDNSFSVHKNKVKKTNYDSFERRVKQLAVFLQIFKPDLVRIDIDRKDKGDTYMCGLVMVYDSYSIDAEFESTGIKKLIELYNYLREMVQGSIVFIDEFDSNLHDVYLCALLEYLMEYGKGQLCFTTHNVGPMDILKQHKKSIDFLSSDHTIYSWTTNGNYSPAKLYRSGMIEGSPFNVDSIDFIGVFETMEDNE